MTTFKRVLFIGAGQIASSVAAQLTHAGFMCFGYSRSPRLHQDQRHLRWVSRAAISKMTDIHTVVFTLTPSDRTAQAYERDYFQSLKHWLAIDSVMAANQAIWVSSTRVYGEDAGQLINQATIPQPADRQGKVLLACEQLFTSTRPHSNIVIRFPGLYGNAAGFRSLIERLQNNPTAQQWPPRWQNRLHRQDASGLIAHCIEHNVVPSHPLIASDLNPTTEWETSSWLAENFGIALKSTRGAESRGKRIQSNISNTTAYRLKVPDWLSGYKPLLKQYQQE